jgi:hypothetical protein
LAGAQSYPATIVVGDQVLTTATDKLFVFDARRMRLTHTIQLPAPQLEISLGQLRDGRVIGLTTQGVYLADPVHGELVVAVKAPVPVRCGFAVLEDRVYFGSNAELWRCHIDGTTP